jgi:hypothetical protein
VMGGGSGDCPTGGMEGRVGPGGESGDVICTAAFDGAWGRAR